MVCVSGDNSNFGINSKSYTIDENEYFIPQASAHANQNVDLTGVKLVVNLPTIKQWYFLSENHTLGFNAIVNYF